MFQLFTHVFSQDKELNENKKDQDENHARKLIEKNPKITHSQVIQVIGQRKALCRQGACEPSCAKKEAVDKNILITSRNSDRKTTQSIRISGRPPTTIKKMNQFSQPRQTSTKVILGNTYTKDFNGYISTMSNGSREASSSTYNSSRTNSSTYPFL